MWACTVSFQRRYRPSWLTKGVCFWGQGRSGMPWGWGQEGIKRHGVEWLAKEERRLEARVRDRRLRRPTTIVWRWRSVECIGISGKGEGVGQEVRQRRDGNHRSALNLARCIARRSRASAVCSQLALSSLPPSSSTTSSTTTPPPPSTEAPRREPTPTLPTTAAWTRSIAPLLHRNPPKEARLNAPKRLVFGGANTPQQISGSTNGSREKEGGRERSSSTGIKQLSEVFNYR